MKLDNDNSITSLFLCTGPGYLPHNWTSVCQHALIHSVHIRQNVSTSFKWGIKIYTHSHLPGVTASKYVNEHFISNKSLTMSLILQRKS